MTYVSRVYIHIHTHKISTWRMGPRNISIDVIGRATINSERVQSFIPMTLLSSTQKLDPRQSAEARVEDFVKQNLKLRYTFSSERGSQESQLCREKGGDTRECMNVGMSSTQLFEAMQALGFYCALPMEPGKTHMECIPIRK